ncbi:hypothetical protein [Pseudonocardia sp. KRD291]|uniref:hypothetical protein n=1 Tax=Pseudonocardia sp. KRD291 TaxID=2792007 RepID=UPI001C49CA2D|nr:hypothetical protein [Pseudonocardia sp. KRD291]MBW0104313.1 hypothetical protein [Pseudonocardia sp. KRD291]
MDIASVDPQAPQDPTVCTHPGAYVHAHVGRVPRERDRAQALTWQPSPNDDGGRRPGEQLNAALGECSACGSLVVTVETWHPDDVRGEHVTSYRTRWMSLYPTGAHPDEPPAVAQDSTRPAPLPSSPA